jgi:hypothetical protein
MGRHYDVPSNFKIAVLRDLNFEIFVYTKMWSYYQFETIVIISSKSNVLGPLWIDLKVQVWGGLVEVP